MTGSCKKGSGRRADGHGEMIEARCGVAAIITGEPQTCGYTRTLKAVAMLAMRLGNPEAIKTLVKAQLGLSFLSYWMADEDLRRGELPRIHLREATLF
jgi:DNA-binding transcriptional LysR family regulator